MTDNRTEREQILEVVTRLFVYTDERKWNKLIDEVFAKKIKFDMSSLGGEKAEITPEQICELWKDGFEGIDSVNHLAGNFLTEVSGNEADVFTYATATHYKESASKGKTREFTGTYDLHLVRVHDKWKIDGFKYNLKYAIGNMNLE